MFCQYCGKEISNDTKFCPNCGQAVNGNNSNGYYQNTNSNNNSFQAVKSEENAAIGILAIVFSVIGGWIGLVFSIIGLCIYKEQKNRRNCKIALGISIAIVAIWIIWVIVAVSLSVSMA